MTKTISQLITTIDNNKNIATAAAIFADQVTTGTNNIVIGEGAAGNVVTTKNSVFIGTDADLADGETIEATIENAIAIGHGAKVTNSNSIVLGSGCKVGIGTTDPKHALHLGNEVNGTTPAIYMDSSTIPISQSITSSAGIFSVTGGVATFTNSDSNKSGTIVVAKRGFTCGEATLARDLEAGISSVKVLNTAVTESSIISVTRNLGASAYPTATIETLGHLFVGSVSTGSFTIFSTVSADVGTINWVIINPQQ